MKGIIVLLATAAFVIADQADMKYFLYKNENGEVVVEDLTGTPDLRAESSDLTFYFYSQRNPTHGVEINLDDLTPLQYSSFSASKDTIFIIHGWKNTFESDVNSHIREYSLRGHDVNVFVVDWSPIAGKNYVSAQGSVVKVGSYVADFIKELHARFGLKLNKLTLIGHSLGAQISGNAGAVLNGTISRIVGLDAAGPLFSVNNINNRLDETDAEFVEGIHTNGGLLGFEYPYGHADFYPNGGKSQPGCGWDLTGTCAHSRVYALFAESLLSSGFKAVRCTSYSDYSDGKCNHGHVSIMGQFIVDHHARGNYYLKTNSEPPYACN